jgi:hypothetical protein
MKNKLACAVVLLTMGASPALAAKEPIPPPDFAVAFNAEDLNHDGKLSWEEFYAAGKEREGRKHGDDARKPTYNWVFHFVERFAQMDLDDDESLTLDEYTRGRLLNENNDGGMRYIQPNTPLPKPVTPVKKQLPLVHPPITQSPKSHEADFAASDTNHDGKVSWDEFLAGREKREGADHGAEAAKPSYFWLRHYVERFQLMDFNFDGSLTLDEFINGRLLNTYNDWSFRFILPKPYQKFPAK